MNYTEQTITVACEQDMLAGILATPEVAASIGVIVIVGGPQYRAGIRQNDAMTHTIPRLFLSDQVRNPHTGMGRQEISAIARHEKAVADLRRCPNNCIRQLDICLLTQRHSPH